VSAAAQIRETNQIGGTLSPSARVTAHAARCESPAPQNFTEKSSRVASTTGSVTGRLSSDMPSMTLTCCICNLPMQQSKTSRPQGEASHAKCRRVHGSAGMYKNGCRCDECKAAQTARMSRYVQKVRAEQGAHPTTLQRRRFKELNGYWPQGGGSAWIDPQVRRSLYERDNWTCHLCGHAVDRGAHHNADLAPSLDHLVPRSITPVPNHSPDNLRTAHRVCNSIKGISTDGRIQPETHQQYEA